MTCCQADWKYLRPAVSGRRPSCRPLARPAWCMLDTRAGPSWEPPGSGRHTPAGPPKRSCALCTAPLHIAVSSAGISVVFPGCRTFKLRQRDATRYLGSISKAVSLWQRPLRVPAKGRGERKQRSRSSAANPRSHACAHPPTQARARAYTHAHTRAFTHSARAHESALAHAHPLTQARTHIHTRWAHAHTRARPRLWAESFERRALHHLDRLGGDGIGPDACRGAALPSPRARSRRIGAV